MIEAAQWKVKWESGLFAKEKASASNAMYQEVRLYLAFMAALWPFLLIKKPQEPPFWVNSFTRPKLKVIALLLLRHSELIY